VISAVEMKESFLLLFQRILLVELKVTLDSALVLVVERRSLCGFLFVRLESFYAVAT